MKKWLTPAACGNWSLGHTNPVKSTPRDIAPWGDEKLLSRMTDEGSYEQRVISGTPRRLVTIWLYWEPEQPPPRQSTPTPCKRTKQAKGKQKVSAPVKPESPRPLAPKKRPPPVMSGGIAEAIVKRRITVAEDDGPSAGRDTGSDRSEAEDRPEG
jgi:hypothetical protein